jgi:4a-hydroxytetrahydrobiopterin dehydratase
MEVTPMAKLDDTAIAAALVSLPGWEMDGDAIRKTIRFPAFMAAIRFVNSVAEIAEAADHHPDIMINYTRVTFVCSTHSAGGVTAKDFRLATAIDRAFGAAAT